MQTWIVFAVRAGVVLTVLGIALQARLDGARYLFRDRPKLARSVVAMNAVLPLFVAIMIVFGGLRGPIAVVLTALSLSPIPPMLPKRVMKAGGSTSYMMELLLLAACLAVVLVPLAVWLLGRAVGTDIDVSSSQVALMVGLTVLGPLGLGVLIHRFAPALAARLARPLSIAGIVLLVAGVLPILVTSVPAMLALIGNGTVLAIVAFVLVGLAAGHLLGGPDPDERTVLAMCTALRHPGVALVIASAYLPDKKQVVAALLLYLVIGAIAALPYQLWAKHRNTKLAHAG